MTETNKERHDRIGKLAKNTIRSNPDCLKGNYLIGTIPFTGMVEDDETIDPKGIDLSFLLRTGKYANHPNVQYEPGGHYDKDGKFIIDEISIVLKR